ncbi:MAG: tetratricopeptide repeat protein [Caldimonas sp.]
MKRWLAGTLLVVVAPFVWALPTVADVDAEVQKGHYAQAESMMQVVVAAKPQSARAHYVLAEILAHNGRFSAAAAEEARARHLDPR